MLVNALKRVNTSLDAMEGQMANSKKDSKRRADNQRFGAVTEIAETENNTRQKSKIQEGFNIPNLTMTGHSHLAQLDNYME